MIIKFTRETKYQTATDTELVTKTFKKGEEGEFERATGLVFVGMGAATVVSDEELVDENAGKPDSTGDHAADESDENGDESAAGDSDEDPAADGDADGSEDAAQGDTADETATAPAGETATRSRKRGAK